MERFLIFMNGAFASYLKVFIGAVLAQYLVLMVSDPNFQVLHWDQNKTEILLKSGIAGLFPVIINALNPKDTRYGLKETRDPEKEKE